jgi:CheY-like chemotaxis protein
VRTVLIVDDEVFLREALELILQMAGYEIHTATHGAEALAMAEEVRPDLVLTDIMMPIMDGVELCRRLKAIRGTPVILMSAAGREAARGAEADAFIAKPFDLDEVEDLVRQFLG